MGAALALSAPAAESQDAPTSPQPSTPSPPTDEQRLAALMDAFFTEILAESPELVTTLGLDRDARAPAKSQLSDASVAGRARRRLETTDRLARLRTLGGSSFTGM